MEWYRGDNTQIHKALFHIFNLYSLSQLNLIQIGTRKIKIKKELLLCLLQSCGSGIHEWGYLCSWEPDMWQPPSWQKNVKAEVWMPEKSPSRYFLVTWSRLREKAGEVSMSIPGLWVVLQSAPRACHFVHVFSHLYNV